MVSQMILNSLIAASVILVGAIGFALIFRVTRFFHFAYGASFALGPYSVILLTTWFDMTLWLAVPLAVAMGSLLGCFMEWAVYRPLRRKGNPSLVLLLASLGLYVVLQNVISLIFGDDTKAIPVSGLQEGINVLGARITLVQIATICVSAVLVVAMVAFLRKTRVGRAMRAVANDAELARVSGINSGRMILWAFAIGSGLAAVAGILVALDVNMTPTMGMNGLMIGVVAVVVGGVESLPGTVLGALLLGFAQHFGVWAISSQWQNAVAFVVLLALLLVRPQGFLGKKVKKAVVSA